MVSEISELNRRIETQLTYNAKRDAVEERQRRNMRQRERRNAALNERIARRVHNKSARVNLDTIKAMLTDAQIINALGIVREIAADHGVSVDAVFADCRYKRVTVPRQAAMRACRTVLGLSFSAIGALFGRHHTTVMHACQK